MGRGEGKIPAPIARARGGERARRFFRRPALGEGGGLRGQGEDLPNFLHPREGFRAGAKAQAQLAAEAAHAPRQMHQQQPVLLKARGAFFQREARAP